MSATEETTTGAIAVRESSGAAIVKAVPIPRELQEVGVRIAEDEGGLRVIVLPPEVRQRVNLLTPVSSWGQADPNWTPAISLVKLEKEAHTYPLPGGKLGLNKQALETLGKTAGVLYTRTERVPRAELQEGELWAYRATAGFRRADGSIEEVTRERGFSSEAERMEIEDSVRDAKAYENGQKTNRPKYANEEAVQAEIRKRWIAELRFGPAKTESKAINRALRAGLQMPTSVKAADLQKPFLVVGFNFTPDYSDPAIKRALVAVGLNAQAAIYGPGGADEEIIEERPAPALLEEGSPERAEELETPVSPAGDQTESVSSDVEQAASDEARAEPPAGGSSATPEPELEDEPEPKRGLQIPEAVIEKAGQTIARGEKTVADAVRQAAEGDAKAIAWLRWAGENLSEGGEDERLGAIRLYAGARFPDLLAALQGEG